MSDQILLIEDDENLGYILKEYLGMNGFKTTWVKNGIEGFEELKKKEYDLLIIDIMMPQKDGFTLAKEIKGIGINTPFIFLTAKTLKVDKLKGFNLGADDYIVKPVDEELLIARIKAILKRNEEDKTEIEEFEIGDYRFKVNSRELILGNKKHTLTPRESDVLELLCQYKGEVLTREEALKKVWGDSNSLNRRIMDVYVSKLRKYLKEDSKVKIKNLHGTGFILSD